MSRRGEDAKGEYLDFAQPVLDTMSFLAETMVTAALVALSMAMPMVLNMAPRLHFAVCTVLLVGMSIVLRMLIKDRKVVLAVVVAIASVLSNGRG
jgi:uncharacterized protein (DUF983 family)